MPPRTSSNIDDGPAPAAPNAPNKSKFIAHNPSFSTKLSVFFLWNGIFAVCLVLGVALYIGSIFHPKTIGLYCLIPYLSYTLFLRRDELRSGNQWPAFSRNFLPFRVMRSYLGLEIASIPKEIIEEDRRSKNSDKSTQQQQQQQQQQFIFAVFPHGTASDYRVLMEGMLHKIIPNIAKKTRTLAASILFRLPLVRELTLWTGCVDARRNVAERMLDGGKSLIIIPGGEAEQIRTTHGKEIVYLSRRKGFVKLAMKKGNVPIVPMYVFGCSDHFWTSHFLFGLRLWLVKNLGICIPLTSGLWGSSCPLPVKTTIVMGEPITFKMKTEGKPTDEELNEAHNKFCDALVMLFDEHKDRLGYGDRKIEII